MFSEHTYYLIHFVRCVVAAATDLSHQQAGFFMIIRLCVRVQHRRTQLQLGQSAKWNMTQQQ